MRGYGRMKVDFIKKSKGRIRELESEIEILGEWVPFIEDEKSARDFSELVRGMNEDAKKLEMSVAELGVSDSESWEWTLEIEDTEWLFKVLKERIDQAKRILEENKNEKIASKNGEIAETTMKG